MNLNDSGVYLPFVAYISWVEPNGWKWPEAAVADSVTAMLSQIEWKKLLVIAVLVGVILGTVLILIRNTFGVSLPPVWMGVIAGALFSVVWVRLTNRRSSR